MGKVYVDRICDLANTQPELMIAHAYVRYLGDLSGGQSLKEYSQIGIKTTGKSRY